METDLERYAWLVAYELREARSSATQKERREHEGLARAYMLKMHDIEQDPQVFLLGANARQRALKQFTQHRDEEPRTRVPRKPRGDRTTQYCHTHQATT